MRVCTAILQGIHEGVFFVGKIGQCDLVDQFFFLCMQKDYGCINNMFLFIFQTTSLDACSQIRERLSEIKGIGEAKLYGLFLTDDGQKGTWLEPSKTLEHYLLRDNVSSFL